MANLAINMDHDAPGNNLYFPVSVFSISEDAGQGCFISSKRAQAQGTYN